jgi:tellurite resistance-related uncharacterized protein
MKKNLICILMLLFYSNIHAQQPSIVAHWDFTNGSTVDLINGWTGTIVGNVVPTTGQNGSNNSAMWFAQSNYNPAYIQVSHHPKMDLHSWTISALVKVDDFNILPGSDCQTSAIVWKGTGDLINHNNGDDHYSLLFGDSPFDDDCSQNNAFHSVFEAKAAGNQNNNMTEAQWLGSPAQPLLQGKDWHCVTATYDHVTEIISLYIDGTLYVTSEWQNQYGNNPQPEDLFIGNSNQVAGGSVLKHQFFGAIDDLKIFDGALQQADIAGLCNRCIDPPLIAHWNFNDNTEEQVHGWTTNVNGSPTFVTGRNQIPNGALRFNGSTDYLQIPAQPEMDLTSWSIKATIRPRGFYSGLCQGNALIWRSPQYSANHYDIQMHDNAFDDNCNLVSSSNNVFAAEASTHIELPQNGWLNGTPPNNLNPFVQPDEWYCVIATYDAVTEQLNLYVEGVLVKTYYWPQQYNYSTPNLDDLFIGASDDPNGLFPFFFNGDIDDIKIYAGVLKCEQAVTNVCCQTPLVAYWPFDNGSANDIIHNWTPSVVVGTSPTTGIDGSPNSALHFNTGDYIQVSSQPAMDLTSWSITAIVRPTSFWEGLCQGNSILMRGSQFSPKCYYMIFTDNPSDGNNCSNTIPNAQGEYFTAGPAGNTTAPVSDWMGNIPGNPPSPPIQLDEWYCVAATYDAVDGVVNMYVGGIHVAQIPWQNQYVYSDVNNLDLFIGSSNNPASPLYPFFFTGDMDELRLYNGVICPNEIPTCGFVQEPCEGCKPGRPNNIQPSPEKQNRFELAPNPANDKVLISVPANWNNVKYTLTNTTGITVLEGAVNGSINFNVKDLPAGVYIVSIQHDGVTNKKKLVVTH